MVAKHHKRSLSERRERCLRKGICITCSGPLEPERLAKRYCQCAACSERYAAKKREANARRRAKQLAEGGPTGRRCMAEITAEALATRGDTSPEAIGLLPKLTAGQPLGIGLEGDDLKRYRELAAKIGL